MIIGWGARHFYTEAATFSDVSLPAWVKGVLGDSSVLRVECVGPVSAVSDVMWIDLDIAHYTQMIANIRADFADTRAIPNASLSDGDRFYIAKGRFNIFKTCNVWLGQQLREAGVPFGIWTPAPHSVRISKWWFGV